MTIIYSETLEKQTIRESEKQNVKEKTINIFSFSLSLGMSEP